MAFLLNGRLIWVDVNRALYEEGYGMNVLLIGGTGILSTEICRIALERGLDVTTLNRGRRTEFINEKSTNIIADIRKENIECLRRKINIKNYDVVIDFISYTPEQLNKSIEMVGNNCKQFIFISSATVYNEVPGQHNYTEDDNIYNNEWDYCVNKTRCEELLKNGQWNFEYSIVRPYITYGKTRIPFQIVPLKYYSFLNRIKNEKNIIVSNKNAICTLTNIQDFAIGVLGLFLNPAAYGEAVHVTSDFRYSWLQVAEIIGKKIGFSPQIIDIPISFLNNISNPGFEVAELSGDKSRNMIFDNAKIKCLVPEFSGEISFEEGIGDSLKFYEETAHQNIDYVWEGRIDRILCMYYKSKKIPVSQDKCGIKGNKEKMCTKDKILYYIGRYEFLYVLAKHMKELLKK